MQFRSSQPRKAAKRYLLFYRKIRRKSNVTKNINNVIILNSRFKFGEEVKTAEVVDATDKNKIRVNGTEFFERVKLTEKDLENVTYEEVRIFGWSNKKPLTSGKYKVTYNQTDYFMTYLDELDLFNSVVKRENLTTSEKLLGLRRLVREVITS